MSDKKIIRFSPRPNVVKSKTMSEIMGKRKAEREQVLRRIQELREKRKE